MRACWSQRRPRGRGHDGSDGGSNSFRYASCSRPLHFPTSPRCGQACINLAEEDSGAGWRGDRVLGSLAEFRGFSHLPRWAAGAFCCTPVCLTGSPAWPRRAPDAGVSVPELWYRVRRVRGPYTRLRPRCARWLAAGRRRCACFGRALGVGRHMRVDVGGHAGGPCLPLDDDLSDDGSMSRCPLGALCGGWGDIGLMERGASGRKRLDDDDGRCPMRWYRALARRCCLPLIEERRRVL